MLATLLSLGWIRAYSATIGNMCANNAYVGDESASSYGVWIHGQRGAPTRGSKSVWCVGMIPQVGRQTPGYGVRSIESRPRAAS